jgi:hypothetical protein
VNLVERAKNILLTPSAEWDKIATEEHTVQGLYTGWIMILAAIPAVAGFIGLSLIGASAFGFSYRVPITYGIGNLVVGYLLSLGSVYVMALIIDGLAPSCGGQKNFMQAFKVAAFTPTASWLAGIFTIIPALSMLSILGLYSLYLLYLGAPRLMKVPEESSTKYVIFVIIAAIVVFLIIGALTALTIPGRAGMGMGLR